MVFMFERRVGGCKMYEMYHIFELLGRNVVSSHTRLFMDTNQPKLDRYVTRSSHGQYFTRRYQEGSKQFEDESESKGRDLK